MPFDWEMVFSYSFTLPEFSAVSFHPQVQVDSDVEK